MIKRKPEGQSGVVTVKLFFHYQSTPRKCVKDYFFLPVTGLFAKRVSLYGKTECKGKVSVKARLRNITAALAKQPPPLLDCTSLRGY